MSKTQRQGKGKLNNDGLVELSEAEVVYVNNILGRDNLEETPVKWEKKRLKIFLKGNKIFP